MRVRIAAACAVMWLATAGLASAQNWSFDARSIALGGVRGVDATGAGERGGTGDRGYTAIVLPFGLLQVLPHRNVFDPGSPEFDPVRAAEYAASPLHYVIGRDDTDTGLSFVNDVRNARVSRDLNVYRGFVPAASIEEAGLASPSWGGTIPLARRSDGTSHGIFVGAGPYFATQSKAVVDDRLRSLLDSDTPVYLPDTTFLLSDTTTNQFALSVTGGYRGRIPLSSMGSGGASLSLSADYHYLRGFLYEAFDFGMGLATDRAGLLVVSPSVAPVNIVRHHATSGHGFALDLGGQIAVDRWVVGLSADGIANRIDWTGVERRRYALASLVTGGEFTESAGVPEADVHAVLPVDVRAFASYAAPTWSAAGEYGHGLQGTTFRGGLERRFGVTAVRGGARFVRDRWEPSGGFGVNLSPRVGIDVAGFSTSANVQRKRHLAIATSIRIMHR